MHLRNKRFASAAALLLCFAIILTACGGKKDSGGKNVIATYKDGTVTEAEFDGFINTLSFFNPMYDSAKGNKDFSDSMIKQLIALKILSARADDASKKEADTQSKQQLDQIKAYLSAQGNWDKQLKDKGLTENDIKDYITRSLTAMIAEEKKVTDDQVRAAYDANVKADPHYYDVVSVAHILIGLKDQSGKDLRTKDEALKRAKEVKDKLDKGGDFAALAKEYSDDPGSKDNGGKYENEQIGQSGWVEPFKKAAAELPVGKISDPFETDFGYHIMRVDKRDVKPFEEEKQALKTQEAGKRIQAYITNDLQKDIVSINLPDKYTKGGNAAGGGQAPAPSGGTGAPAGK